MADNDIILKMSNICKSFPGVIAVHEVDFTIRRGTVHALMGENGAGKSTLMKILSGLYQNDSGEILFQGKPLDTSSVQRVLQRGISMIYQELNPVDSLTVAENVYCGKEPSYWNSNFFLNRKVMINDTTELLKELNITSISAEQKVASLSMGQKQLLEIVKAVANNSSLLIMDEPTSAITEKECQLLFEIVRHLKTKGISFVFITHKIEEIFQIADEITVMRDGKIVGTDLVEAFTYEKVVQMMVGREMTEFYPKEEVPIGDVSLEVEELCSQGKFEDVSFTARRGEILGFSGLMGSGRTEIMETIWGYRQKTGGSIKIGGKPVSINKPYDAIRHKLAFLTEDRRGLGCFLQLNLFNNIMMLSWLQYGMRFFIPPAPARKAAQGQIHLHQIKTTGLEQQIRNLSGGNQQKALFARWLLTDPEILILDEPTRGIDVGSKYEIYKEMIRCVKEGKTILMISSDLLEVIGMSDRIVVMHEGRVSTILDRDEFDQETILYYASGLVKGVEEAVAKN